MKKKPAISTRRKGMMRPKDLEFCMAVGAQGMSAPAAYREHIAMGKVTTRTAQQEAWRLMQRPEFALKITEYREKDVRTIEEKLGFGREQIIRFLVEGATTPVGEVDENSPLAQEVKIRSGSTEAGEWEEKTVKMVGKLDCIEKLGKMLNLYPNSGGANGGIPQITINLGAIFSPPTEGAPLKAVRMAEAVRIG